MQFFDPKPGGAMMFALILAAAGTLVLGNSMLSNLEFLQRGANRAADTAAQYRARELLEIGSNLLKDSGGVPTNWYSASEFFDEGIGVSDSLDNALNEDPSIFDGTSDEYLVDICMSRYGKWGDSGGVYQLGPDEDGQRQKFSKFDLGGVRILPKRGSGVVIAGAVTDVSNSLAADFSDVHFVVGCGFKSRGDKSSNISIATSSAFIVSVGGRLTTAELREL